MIFFPSVSCIHSAFQIFFVKPFPSSVLSYLLFFSINSLDKKKISIKNPQRWGQHRTPDEHQHKQEANVIIRLQQQFLQPFCNNSNFKQIFRGTIFSQRIRNQFSRLSYGNVLQGEMDKKITKFLTWKWKGNIETLKRKTNEDLDEDRKAFLDLQTQCNFLFFSPYFFVSHRNIP